MDGSSYGKIDGQWRRQLRRIGARAPPQVLEKKLMARTAQLTS